MRVRCPASWRLVQLPILKRWQQRVRGNSIFFLLPQISWDAGLGLASWHAPLNFYARMVIAKPFSGCLAEISQPVASMNARDGTRMELSVLTLSCPFWQLPLSKSVTL